jgi:hypothetical protein
MSSNLLPGVDRSTIIKVVAIWLVISGVLGLCGGLALLGVGALGGLFGAGTAAVISESGATGTEAAGAAAAGAALAVASGFAVVLGILFLILAPASLVVAWSLFNRRQWSRMGVVVLMGISAIVSLLSILTGGGLGGNLIPLVIDTFVAYFFYTDPGIQQALSN